MTGFFQVPTAFTPTGERVRGGAKRTGWAGWALTLAAGLAIGLMGPFGSYANPIWTRLPYWIIACVAGAALFRFALPPLAGPAGARGWQKVLWLSGAAALLCAPLGVATRFAAVALWPDAASIGWLEWYGQCLVITAAISALTIRTAPARARVPDQPRSDSLLSQIPGRLGADVLCLHMEDHYVRVHTPEGSALVLMPLARAMAALPHIPGLQTHRSWWVARGAVTGIVEDGRRTRLLLRAGLEAPVSRARVSTLRAEGWLDT